MPLPRAQPCPCGRATAYSACCGPLHLGARQAATAEELMRARYSAYAVGDMAYLTRTWHPRTRPDDLIPVPEITWTGLEVLGHEAGAADDEEGTVTFRASYRRGDRAEVVEERSRFLRRGGRWVYLDGDDPGDT